MRGQLQTLLINDWHALKFWFSKQLVSKLIVLVGFFLVGAFVSFLIGVWAWFYISSLKGFEIYGALTAQYLVRATLLLIGFLGIGSAFAASLVTIFNPGKENNYLMTLPVRSYLIVIWLNLKTLVLNWFLTSLVIVPLGVSYMLVFNETLGVLDIVRLFEVTLLLTLIVNGIGSLLAHLIAPWFRSFSIWGTLALVLAFFGFCALLIFRIIFPQPLRVLYDVPIEEFMPIYESLPLLNQWWPSNWLSEIVFSGVIQGYEALVLGVVVYVSALLVQSRTLVKLWQEAKELGGARLMKFIDLEKDGGLIAKDLVSVLRVPSEWGYSLLLMGMAISFFGLLLRANLSGYWTRRFETDIIVTSFGFLLFFVTAFCLRIIFPLMAREGSLSWWLFTLPIKKSEILRQKLKTGVIIGTPLMVMSVLLWILIPIGDKTFYIGVFSGGLTLILLLLQGLWGMIAPVFEQAEKPDQASTSLSGLVSLILSLIIVGISGQLLSRTLDGISTANYLIIWVIAVVMALSVSLFLAVRAIKNYQF